MALPFAGLDLPEQAMGWFPLGLGLVVEDRPTEFSCMHTRDLFGGGGGGGGDQGTCSAIIVRWVWSAITLS